MIFVTVYGAAYTPPAATAAYAEASFSGVGAAVFRSAPSGPLSRTLLNGSSAVPASTAPPTASLNGCRA